LLLKKKPARPQSAQLTNRPTISAASYVAQFTENLKSKSTSFSNAVLQAYAQFVELVVENGLSLLPSDTPGNILEKAQRLVPDQKFQTQAELITDWFLEEAFGKLGLNSAQTKAMQNAIAVSIEILKRSRADLPDS
jgi:hypothetical protein